MTSQEIVPIAEAEVRRYMDLFGPAPLLSGEDPKPFEELFVNLARCQKPRDFLTWLLVWEIAVDTWDGRRCSRHTTIALDRSLRHKIDSDVKAEKQIKAHYEKILHDKAQKQSQSPSDVAEIAELQRMVEERLERIDAILVRQPNDVDINVFFRLNMEFLHDLDQLHNSADRRRYNKFVLLEKHSASVDRAARESNEVVDAEFQEVEPERADLPKVKTATGTNLEAAVKAQSHNGEETHELKIPSAPSIIPTNGNANDVEPQNRIESMQ
jgi:hypothetical protein